MLLRPHMMASTNVAALMGGGFDEDAQAYFAAMATPPSAALAATLNARIVSLKTSGVWTREDWISWFDVETEQQSLLNAKNPALMFAKVGTPTFSAGNGWTGSAGNYLDANWNPATHGVNFTRDSAFMAASVRSNSAGSSSPLGNAKARVNPRNASNNISVAPNATATTAIAAPGTTAIGVTAWDRSASNAGKVYRDGAVATTFTTASEALQSDDIFACAYNNAGTAVIDTRQVRSVAWGGSLSDEQHAALAAVM